MTSNLKLNKKIRQTSQCSSLAYSVANSHFSNSIKEKKCSAEWSKTHPQALRREFHFKAPTWPPSYPGVFRQKRTCRTLSPHKAPTAEHGRTMPTPHTVRILDPTVYPYSLKLEWSCIVHSLSRSLTHSASHYTAPSTQRGTALRYRLSKWSFHTHAYFTTRPHCPHQM